MSKKIPLGIALACIFIAIALTVSVTVAVYMNIYNELIQDLPQRAQLYSGLSDIDELVRDNYFGTIESGALDASIAKGYVEGLGDKYSFYMSADEYNDYYQTMLGNVSGTGIQAAFDEEQELLIITNVAQGSPAQQSELKKGDIITAIEGDAITADNYESKLTLLEGEKLSGVNLEIKRPATEEQEEKRFSVNVAKGYKAQSCFYSLSGTIGYIRITSFFENTPETFEKALDSFNQSGITGLIIDVRNNASDNIEYALKIIDRMVPMATEGTMAMATTKNAKGEIVDTYSSDSVAITLPVAVLINDRTQGAAELLACDLKDFGIARLFGETTAGHGTMQKIFRLNDGGAVLLSVARIYPYISDCYDEIGVVPNESISMSETDKNKLDTQSLTEDAQYTAALNYLS